VWVEPVVVHPRGHHDGTALVDVAERVMRINDLTVITSDVIETARSTLVIGDT
jgi:hypothetical protein